MHSRTASSELLRGRGRCSAWFWPRRRLLLVLACLTLLALLSTLPAESPPCPPGRPVLVASSRYLRRGNVGHWGYALFGLDLLLRRAGERGEALPPELVLFFGGPVSHGDWVARALAALERRHGVALRLAGHAAGSCAAAAWGRVDANEVEGLLAGRDPALGAAWRDVCGLPAQTPPPADVLVFNRHGRSTRRLCDLPALEAQLAAHGLTWRYEEVPSSACAQVAALSPGYRFIITPHGAHEVNLFAVAPNTTVVEVMPRWTDIPIYNRLVGGRPVWVVSEALPQPYPCQGGVCEPLPAAYGTCTRHTLCRKWARNRPCVRVNAAALAGVLTREVSVAV